MKKHKTEVAASKPKTVNQTYYLATKFGQVKECFHVENNKFYSPFRYRCEPLHLKALFVGENNHFEIHCIDNVFHSYQDAKQRALQRLELSI
jgi:hypothetical protein